MVIIKNGFRIEFTEEKWSSDIKTTYSFKDDNIVFNTDRYVSNLSLFVNNICYKKTELKENKILLNPFELPFGMYLIEIASGNIRFAKCKLEVSKKSLY